MSQSRDKQIAEMAEIILDVDRSYYGMACDEILAKAEATAIYDKDFRKIYDDHERQCTCYALGCQMAEELKREVAREIFEEIEKFMSPYRYPIIAELKKEYTEGKKDV